MIWKISFDPNLLVAKLVSMCNAKIPSNVLAVVGDFFCADIKLAQYTNNNCVIYVGK
jgi:hypothetical protein